LWLFWLCGVVVVGGLGVWFFGGVVLGLVGGVVLVGVVGGCFGFVVGVFDLWWEVVFWLCVM